MLAFMVAFGAGALLFAVTVELYGEAVDRLEEHGFISGSWEMGATAVGALIGAILYILCCRWIDWAVQGAESNLSGDRDSGDRDPLNNERRADQLESGHHQNEHGPGVYSAKEMGHVRGRKRAVMGVLDPALHTHMTVQDSKDSPKAGTYGATRSSEQESSDRHYACDSKRLDEIRVAIFIWLGALLDGIPEAIMLGYLAAEQKLSVALVMALFVSNFPESFSSAVLLVKHGIARWKVVAMWGFLCIFTGVLACATAYALPDSMLSKRGEYKKEYSHLKIIGALIEGMAGGAMLACISNVMLPDAFKRRGDMVGMFVLLGFLVAVSVKVFGGIVDELY
jgi:zinc transporter ZupT